MQFMPYFLMDIRATCPAASFRSLKSSWPVIRKAVSVWAVSMELIP